MRSARMLLTTAAASAVLVLGAPGAHASGGSWDHDDSSSYSKEHHKGHDGPHGGMHTGGGALTAVTEDDWSTTQGKESKGSGKDSWGGKESSGSGKESWGGKDKPHGGMHTGGGALAAPSMTAGGLAVLAVAASGLYAARRKKTAAGLA